MPALTPEQEMLKQAALAATPGPWLHRHDPGNPVGVQHGVRLAGEFGAWVCDCLDNADQSKEGGVAGDRNAQFIAAANPAAILAILVQLEAAEGVSTLPSTPLPGSAQLECDAAKFYAIRKEYDEYMSDSFAQQIGVSFADWKLRYKVAAPGEPGQ